MPQFFIDTELERGSEVQIRGSDAHHILDVLRLSEGDWIVLSDGGGRSFRTTIVKTGKRSVTVSIEDELVRPDGPPPPTLAIASIRGERLEWAIQKCVELGMRQAIPFESSRTVRRVSKPDRLARIAMEAAKQSGLPHVPEIESPVAFPDLCARIGDFSPAILLYEGEDSRDLKSVLKTLEGDARTNPLLIVGPEGGFAKDEVELAKSSGAVTAGLGPQILRVETAAVAAMAICQYELGNMDARPTM